MDSNHKASRKVSRRVVLGTAGVGVLGAAGAAVGITMSKESNGTTSTENAGNATNAGAFAEAPQAMLDGSPVVFYLDPQNAGQVRIYRGTSEVLLDDKNLADSLWAAARNK
jgi:TPP-dependent pyruvate/acetoin dehydrogenase alpha subunit